MLPLLWLAFSVPPSAIELAPVPVMDAAVVQRLADPPRCLTARCASGEWLVQAMPAIPAGQLRVDGNNLPGAGGRLRVLAQPRKDWMKAKGSNARVGLQATQASHLVGGAGAESIAVHQREDSSTSNSGNNVHLESELLAAGEVRRAFELNTAIVKAFNRMTMMVSKG